jgi:hypothetical protein
MTSGSDRDPSSPASSKILIHWGPFARTILAPLIVWGVLVVAALLANVPGVVCVTPMAWLLALWCGTQYVNLCRGDADRPTWLGPVLIGGLLGLGEGILFIVVSSLGMPATTPEDAAKAQVLSLGILVVGIVACAGLCTLTAWMRLRSYARQNSL